MQAVWLDLKGVQVEGKQGLPKFTKSYKDFNDMFKDFELSRDANDEEGKEKFAKYELIKLILYGQKADGELPDIKAKMTNWVK
jgi:hypothetical protein